MILEDFTTTTTVFLQWKFKVKTRQSLDQVHWQDTLSSSYLLIPRVEKRVQIEMEFIESTQKNVDALE